MIRLRMNGLPVEVEPGSTLLEVARFTGIPIPTLCHVGSLTPYGGCRLCVVEIGSGAGARLVTACSYPAEDGLSVRTASARVLRARRMIIELLLACCPRSKVVQDLAAAHDVRRQRFRQRDDDCILCGRCVRICDEQMGGKAIGFRGRGQRLSVGTAFDGRSEACRLCGGCMYVCPACQLRCTYHEPGNAICGACANLSPPCLASGDFQDMMCFLAPCVACEIGRSGAVRKDQ